ncbi:unnamed protein product [Durusdinium trenchii]|uniref:Mitochondrial n=2 Tax=Durusdinium trenchii TaxID=1381693 RepID=A0ABP0H6E5_9DINO
MDASGAPHAAGGRSVELSAVRRCVVKVFVRSSQPNWTSPWQRRPQRAGSGSGFCINASRRQILTNAHVVGDAVTVRVRRYGHAARYPAKVLCISPQVDLALLEVPAEAFWEAPPALSSVELSEEVPELDSDVLTVGYPLGGENICVTRGVVSRIDLMDYTFSPVGGERQLVMQVDAAINPGNSGGPVLDASGKAVGVAFAKLQSSANIGYVIPGSVVRYFLRGVARCRSPVLCALGVRLQPARSAALRAWHGLETEDGALVVDVAPLSAAAQAGLKAGDVLLAIDDVPVAEDGSIPFRDAERIGFDFLVSRRVTGDLFSVKVWRSEAEEKALQVHVSAKPLPQLVPRRAGVDCVPSYLVVGGLVFMPLTLPWLLARFSEVRKAPGELQAKLWEHKEHPEQEVIVLAKVLAAEVNYGYQDLACYELLSFAGRPVRSLRALRDRLQELHAAGSERFLRFGLSFNLEIVLEAEQCRQTHSSILQQHGIQQDCSSDLLEPAARL